MSRKESSPSTRVTSTEMYEDKKTPFEALFDSGYSTGALSVHSASNLDSAKQIDKHGNIVTTDSGLCIDSREDVDSELDIKGHIASSTSLPPTTEEKIVHINPNHYLPNEEGNTILHVAVANRHQTSTTFSIIKDVPHPDLLDVRDRLGLTAIHWAALTGQHLVVRQLLVSGATVDLRNVNGDTALHIACQNGDLDCVKGILRPISPSEVIEAQLHHYTPQIQGTNMIEFIHLMNYEGQTSVHLAAKSGNKKLLEYLKMVGADFNVKEGKSGWTCLHWAVASGRHDLVPILISMSRVDMESYAGYTPLDLVCSMIQRDPNNQVFRRIMLLLLEAGAKRRHLDSRSDDDDTEEDDEDTEEQM